MIQENKGSWLIPVLEAPRMLDLTAILEANPADAASAEEPGGPPEQQVLNVGIGNESAAMNMLLEIRKMVIQEVNNVRSGLSAIREIGTWIAVAQYEFAREALNDRSVSSAQVDFEVEACIQRRSETQSELTLTTRTRVYRVITGNAQLFMPADVTFAYSIKDSAVLGATTNPESLEA